MKRRQRVIRYKKGEKLQDPAPKPLDYWRQSVEEQLQEAADQGAFDDLAGHGRPLDLKENPFLDKQERPVHRLLKDHGYLPVWIALDQEIRQLQQRCEERLERALALQAEVLGEARRRYELRQQMSQRRHRSWWPFRRRRQADEGQAAPAASTLRNSAGEEPAVIPLREEELARLRRVHDETCRRFREEWAQVNQLARRYNMEVPLLHLQRRVVPPEERIEQFSKRWRSNLIAGLTP